MVRARVLNLNPQPLPPAYYSHILSATIHIDQYQFRNCHECNLLGLLIYPGFGLSFCSVRVAEYDIQFLVPVSFSQPSSFRVFSSMELTMPRVR
jgi:hypothetical protein